MPGPNTDILNLDKTAEDKKKKDIIKRQRNKDLTDLRFILNTPQGRRVWRRLLEECGPLRNPYAGDVNLTHINIGKQDIGQWAMREMDMARPSTMQEMNREYKSDLALREAVENNSSK